MPRIESLLAARSFLNPQIHAGRVYFISNLSGRLSLYVMDEAGSMPEALLPPNLALQNPELIGGYAFYVFPALQRILVMLDNDGDEHYRPMWIPITGGYPEPLGGDFFAAYRTRLILLEGLTALFNAESLVTPLNVAFRVDLDTGHIQELARSEWGAMPVVFSPDKQRVILADGYTVGDMVLYDMLADGTRRVLAGTPLEARTPGTTYPLTAFGAAEWVGEAGLLITTGLFQDTYGFGFIDLNAPGTVSPVRISGQVHHGVGEMVGFDRKDDDSFFVHYNIDGCSWTYEADYDLGLREMKLIRVIVGQGETAGGETHGFFYNRAEDKIAFAHCTATRPTQIYVRPGRARAKARRLTDERPLGLAPDLLAPGEDASFSSHDGLRISARLYRPAPALGFTGARPLVYYIHGGPQGQERPNFAWFSMPLIQFLTLNGFAVFVPNVRGSTGYGLSYTKHVDRDWGGQDRLDHVWAMTEILPKDPGVDVTRAGVVGRSYGGYMTLTLALRHPELWRAAVDMFGPYDLFTFMERIPETWKAYFRLAVGDPDKDRDLLVERSPRTYINNLACPMLVIQGKNDPRVIEQESRDVVEQLRAAGKTVDYLMFEDEGHDVLKFPNRVTCYNRITSFFAEHLRP